MQNDEFEFNSDFMTDEEVQEMLETIDALAEVIDNEEKKTTIINPCRLKQVLYTYKVLKYLTKGIKGAKVYYELYEPYKSMGNVSVVGRNLLFRKPKWFMEAVKFADNFEAYPKTDGTVQMDFTFHGLTKPLE